MSAYPPWVEVGTEDKKKSMSGVIFHGLNCPCCQSTPKRDESFFLFQCKSIPINHPASQTMTNFIGMNSNIYDTK